MMDSSFLHDNMFIHLQSADTLTSPVSMCTQTVWSLESEYIQVSWGRQWDSHQQELALTHDRKNPSAYGMSDDETSGAADEFQ